MVVYKSYTHVERLGTVDTDGILNGTCYITPKIDGTNACVWFDGMNLCGGSRTRELSEEKDNAGFYAWIKKNSPQVVDLMCFCMDNPNYIVYGEWLGASKFIGHIKDYTSNALGTLWIFDVYDAANGAYLSEDVWRAELDSYGLTNYAVPLLLVKDNPTAEELLELAERNTFLLDNANHPGEGIVIKNPQFVNCYGRPCYAKIVRDEFKQDKAKKQHIIVAGENEANIVSEYVTDAEMAKAKEKTAAYFEVDEFDSHQAKHVGFYLNLVYNDCILEECKNWTKKFKVDNISFNTLKHLALDKARKYIGL